MNKIKPTFFVLAYKCQLTQVNYCKFRIILTTHFSLRTTKVAERSIPLLHFLGDYRCFRNNSHCTNSCDISEHL